MKKVFILASLLLTSCFNEQVTRTIKGEKGDAGAAGAIGPVGPSGLPGVNVVNPCDTKSLFEEVLLVTPDGIVALYNNEDTGLSYLTVLPPGEYKTSDSTDCIYTVEPDITVSW